MKKSQTTTISVFIGVIIIVISFFVIFLFISKTGANVSNEAEDIYCRALIMGKEFTKVPVLGSYILEINKRCFTEDLKIENKDEISSLDPIAESMKSCWFRYGEGKFDFLENFDDPSGDWCFKCANIEFKNKYADDYEYEDLLNYLKKKYITIQKDTSYGKVGERISYYDYLNVISTSFSNDDSIREDFLNTLETNQDEFTKEFFLLLDLELENFLNSYKNKKIRASEDLFIVYRYIRVDRDLID
ncbi:hypothetical protein EOM09_04050, partial [bacterium]|nr:hypothetical protein [bacterium]